MARNRWPARSGISGRLGQRPVTFNTLGSSFDTLLAVYTNNAGSVTLTNLGLVTAEDDIGGNAGWVYQSQVGFSAVSNTAYYLSVNTSVEGLDNTGSVVLNWFSASANTNVPTIPSGTFFFSLTTLATCLRHLFLPRRSIPRRPR